MPTSRMDLLKPNPAILKLRIFENGGVETFIAGSNITDAEKLCFQYFNGPSFSVRSIIVSPNKFLLNTWNLITVTLNADHSINTLYLNGNRIAQVKTAHSSLLNAGIVL